MKVALINPPSPFLLDQKVFPPLALLYLSASLKHEVDVFDFGFEEDKNRFGELKQEYDVVGLSFTTPNSMKPSK